MKKVLAKQELISKLISKGTGSLEIGACQGFTKPSQNHHNKINRNIDPGSLQKKAREKEKGRQENLKKAGGVALKREILNTTPYSLVNLF